MKFNFRSILKYCGLPSTLCWSAPCIILSLTSLLNIVVQSKSQTAVDDSSAPIKLQWEFPSTKITTSKSRMAKLGDRCFYPAWLKHAQPILVAMKRYNKVKMNYKEHFEKAKRNKRTNATNANEYVKEIADKIFVARNRSANQLREQIETQSLQHPYDIRESGDDTSNLMKLLCEGGELLKCKQFKNTEFGVCHCFDMELGKPMYSTEAEDGHCRGTAGVTCNGEDPIISMFCLGKLMCVNLTQPACNFEFGPNFHCNGYPAGVIGKQNMFCVRANLNPEKLGKMWLARSSSNPLSHIRLHYFLTLIITVLSIGLYLKQL